MAQMLPRKLGRAPQCAAINVAGDPLHIVRVLVAARGRHFEQHRWPPWHHQVAGGGSSEHETPATLTVLERELLRQCAAPGYAQNVDLRASQLIEELRGQPGDSRWAIRQSRRRRTADAGHVKDDRWKTLERVEKRFDQFDIGTDAIEHEQRHQRLVAAPNADAQRLPSDIMQTDLHLGLPHISPGRRLKPRILFAAKFIWCRFRLARAGLYPF